YSFYTLPTRRSSDLNTLPILDNFLFELENGKLTVSASDLETTMNAILDVDSSSQGNVAVPARLLLDILKTFPEQPLTFVVEDNRTEEHTSELQSRKN